jgi:hypothetical protein
MTAMMPEFARKLTDEFNKLEWESHERTTSLKVSRHCRRWRVSAGTCSHRLTVTALI